MRDFTPIKFDPQAAREQVSELRTFLEESASLSERKHLAPFFRKRRQLCALIGTLNPGAAEIDLISYELSFFRDFSSDIALGDKRRKAFTLVELEDATPASVFSGGTKNKPDWSSRLEHGQSQIVDWLWRLADWHKTDDFDDTFGKGADQFTTLLIVGRDQFLDDSMKGRLNWRRNNLVVASAHIRVLTYDQLLEILETRVSSMLLMGSPGKPVRVQEEGAV